MRRHLPLVALFAALLGTVVLELSTGFGEESRMPALPPHPLPAPFGKAVPETVAGRDAIAAILARPLFSPGRRPVSMPPGMAAPLPRLTGIFTDHNRRSAIFAAAEGGKPLVLDEGGRISGYVVHRIEAGEVTLSGPGGTRSLRPTFDPRPAARPAAPPPGMPGVSGMPGVTDAALAPGTLGIPGLPSSPGTMAR